MAGQLQLNLEDTSHRNHFLFSDHYLHDVLRHTDTWRTVQTPARDFLKWLKELYGREGAQLGHYNEAQLEENWLRPIMEQLGHTWETQAVIPGLGGGIKKPDYVFFPDETARKKAIAAKISVEYAAHALAIGEAKKWDINLSRKTGNSPDFADNNPMYQIDTYVHAAGVSWGVLSNGRRWRLVHRESSRTLDTYFEIDLLDAIQRDGNAALAVAMYFCLFFRQEAFQRDARGRVFLDDALRQSRDYALSLEADLRDNAYRALEQLILGFFAANSELNEGDANDRRNVYRNSLYLLYRLLFLFYGESRGLLPMGNDMYRERHSATALAREIDGKREQIDSLYERGRLYWHRLEELFRLINGSDPAFNETVGVPRYNGGLFDSERHPFLHQHYVGERHLARAIDYLAYRRVREDGQFRGYQAVDYRTLGVRQLGSIYEGLLEYRVEQAAGEMVTIRKGGVEQWVPAAERGRSKVTDRRQPGELYMATDKGERKATGSYYTPDYIVKYIVDRTLGPLVDQIREETRAAVRNEDITDEETRRRRGAARFVERMLALNVLDPAMGSGHFLVEATNYLARALATDEYVVVESDADNAAEGSAAETEAEADLTYWRRRVVEACIYGVDKNEMAVELARLSLWLATAAAEKPLSFLDHHLRHGDSLVGAWLEDLHRFPGGRLVDSEDDQDPLFDDSAFTHAANRAVADVMAIEEATTDSLEDVYLKERLWTQIQETHLAGWRQLADLWVSAYFGNEMGPEEYRAAANRLQGRESLLGEAQARQFLEHPAALENDYFHWELAFPEVFFDRYGRSRGDAAGFDAVIGNPPYVRQEQISALKPFFERHFADVYSGTADLFVYFFAQGILTLRRGARLAYISSNSWLRANYATRLRAFLRTRTTVETIVDLGDNRVFADAPDVYPAIPIVRRETPPEEHQAQAAEFRRGEGIADFETQLGAKLQTVTIHTQPDSGWQLDDRERRLFEKLIERGEPLEKVVGGEIYYGVKTGLNDAFIIDRETRDRLVAEDPRSAEIIKPMLRGADLRPWYQAFQGEYLVVVPSGWTSTEFGPGLEEPSAWRYFQSRYSSVAHHLKPFAARARKRHDKGEYWWELRACDYYDAFDHHKIFWPELAKIPRFSWNSDGAFVNNKGYIMPSRNRWLLASLGSRVTWFVISKIGLALGERAGLERYQLYAQYTSRIPIPEAPVIQLNRLDDLAEQLTAHATSRYSLQEQIRHRITIDLGREGTKLNTKLKSWWELDFSSFRRQVKKALKQDIPLAERNEWERYFNDRRAQNRALTAEIVRLETELNARVYELFDLTPEEIAIIEKRTKYKYGEI